MNLPSRVNSNSLATSVSRLASSSSSQAGFSAENCDKKANLPFPGASLFELLPCILETNDGSVLGQYTDSTMITGSDIDPVMTVLLVIG